MACSLGFYGDGISFQVVFSQSFWLRALPGAARLVQPRWMPERRILGDGQTCGVSFWPFLDSGWWWLISFMFLTRTSCCKTIYSNGYYGAWPGWMVSVSVLPLTVALFTMTKKRKQLSYPSTDALMKRMLLLLLLSRSVMSNSVRPHRWQPTRLLLPWDFPGKSTEVECHHLLHKAQRFDINKVS